MVLYARTRWPVTFFFLLLAAFALVHGGAGPSGVVLAVLALLPVAAVHRMRLRADNRGVTVVNFGRAKRIGWSEISDFQMGRVGLSTCLDVCRHDRTRVHAWVVTTTGAAGYPVSRVNEVVVRLREMLMHAAGVSREQLDARALDDALALADEGDHSRAGALVAEGRVDPGVMAAKLIERSRSRPAGTEPDR